MSSANAVELIVVPEPKYGTTPPLDAAAVGYAVRFTTESLSGTPSTTASQENRVDRMSGGQVVTGLEVGGAINGELSPDGVYRTLFKMGMMSDPVLAVAPIPMDGVTVEKDLTNPQLARFTIVTGDWNVDLVEGQAIVFVGFEGAAAVNNGPGTVVTLEPTGKALLATTRREAVDIIIPPGEAAFPSVLVPAYLDIGTEVFSMTMSKAYTDVLHPDGPDITDEHSQRYTGGIVNGFSVAMTYGEIVGVVFTMLANGYLQEFPSLSQQIEAAGGDIVPAGTANILNASIDMGMVTVDGLPTEFCIESLTLTLDNGNTPQNCLGKAAPTRYNVGTAAINVEATIYLADPAYDAFMPAKLTQKPVGMFFAVSNEEGGYAFDLRAVQLSFPDPAVTGQNAPVMIDAAGIAKVGDGGASALRVYYW